MGRSGEVNSQSLECLQSTLQEVFCPVLAGMSSRMWGQAKQQYVDTLTAGMTKFGSAVDKASVSLRSGVSLATTHKKNN